MRPRDAVNGEGIVQRTKNTSLRFPSASGADRGFNYHTYRFKYRRWQYLAREKRNGTQVHVAEDPRAHEEARFQDHRPRPPLRPRLPRVPHRFEGARRGPREAAGAWSHRMRPPRHRRRDRDDPG